jgi:hypothetical protein
MMIQDKNNFSENDSLAVITTMINRAKNHFGETGTLYLLWGWVIFICCTVQFIMIRFFENEQAYFVWYLTWLAAIYQVYYIVKRKRTEKVKTYTGDIVGMVWLTFMICLFLSLFILLKYHAYWAIHPIILVLYGMPTFISGTILKFRSLRIGGIICWLLAIAATFVDHQYQLLLLSLAVVAAWIVPGYLLRNKYKTQSI